MVNVPPLLCSTPPPIDFGEDEDDSGLPSTLHLEDGDADEYSDYGLVTTEAVLNAKAPSLPELPITAEYTIPNEQLTNGLAATTTTTTTVEAFNYEVKTPPACEESAIDPCLSQQIPTVEHQAEQEQDEDEPNTNDNMPSLKLDSLSLYSSESSDSPSGQLTPVADEKHSTLSHQVTLEDVSDDSDEECSPKKPKELFIPEGAADFFAIEIVDTPTAKVPPTATSSDRNESPITASEITFAAFQETPPEDINQPQTVDDDDDDDFGDFADFAEATATAEILQPVQEIVSNNNNNNVVVENDDDDDDEFDDFQDFATPTTTAATEPPTSTTVLPVSISVNKEVVDDDDDFGDFSEPAFAATVAAPPALAPVLPQPPPPAVSLLSLDERIKPVLELMFPSLSAQSDLSAGKQRPLAETQNLQFGAIEQAHALDYQWVSSEMRHSLVRSLGIDSRNILFGDKWNSSMPRFAANLSYDPLKPLKPQTTAAGTPQSTPLEPQSLTSWQNTSQQGLEEESHIQTLQLEPQPPPSSLQQQEQQQLDQVTMVANADKINLVTSNYSHDNPDDAAAHLDAELATLTINNNNNNNANDMHNLVTHFATISTTTTNTTTNTITTTTTTINTNLTAHDAFLDLSLEATTDAAAATATIAATPATVAQTSQVKAQSGAAYGQEQSTLNDNSSSSSGSGNNILNEATATTVAADTAATTSVFAVAAATATLSSALPADGNGHSLDNDEHYAQQQQQQQLQLRESPAASPTPTATTPPTPAAAATATLTTTATILSINSSQKLHEVSTNSYTLPLKETHIYTPSKSDTAVAKTTTLAPIDFDYEIASAGIIIDETVVKKEYRDVEYKPPYTLDSPTKLKAAAPGEDDDFSDFQSVPVAIKASSAAQLQPVRNGTPTFGEQMILSPAILLPQTIPLAKPSIEWGENAANINADELARIEELFSQQSKPPTISATVAHQSPKQQANKQQTQQHEDDEWSDFVSVAAPQQQQQQQLQQHSNHNNNVIQKPPLAAVHNKEDDWSDFVSSTPLSTASLRAGGGVGGAAPQFNSGAWQSANFYNNPMSLYQQQQQPLGHSNLVLPNKYQQSNNNQHNHHHNNNNSKSHNNNNNSSGVPQQIHMMHDFSTAPTAAPLATTATYQQQHHQHHQQQLQQQQQQQQRQQFHLGNAKVAPRISLIPDLSFVAPALPTNAGAFMSSLPKPTFSAKK